MRDILKDFPDVIMAKLCMRKMVKQGGGSGIRGMRILGRANYKKGAWPFCGTADGSLWPRVVEGTEVTVEGREVRAAEHRPRRSRWGARPLGNWETRTSLCFCKTPIRNSSGFSKKEGC